MGKARVQPQPNGAIDVELVSHRPRYDNPPNLATFEIEPVSIPIARPTVQQLFDSQNHVYKHAWLKKQIHLQVVW